MRLPRPRFEEIPPRTWARLTIVALLVAYLVAFIAENSRHVHVHFVVVTASVSLIWVILLSLAIGGIGGLLLPTLRRYRRRRDRGEPGDPV
jgi:uncharacterized integral membrane protein